MFSSISLIHYFKRKNTTQREINLEKYNGIIVLKENVHAFSLSISPGASFVLGAASALYSRA